MADKLNNISSAAVKKATGKSWPQWLRQLDGAGCKKMSHQEIVAVVGKKLGVKEWWQQMVTVGYEQARGLRVKHQTAGGFSVNINRTLEISADKLTTAWTNPRIVSRWLDGNAFAITKATPGRSVRMKWLKDDSRVNVMLYPKGATKTQMSVEHSKLASAAIVEKMRKFWKTKIEKLEKALTRSSSAPRRPMLAAAR